LEFGLGWMWRAAKNPLASLPAGSSGTLLGRLAFLGLGQSSPPTYHRVMMVMAMVEVDLHLEDKAMQGGSLCQIFLCEFSAHERKMTACNPGGWRQS